MSTEAIVGRDLDDEAQEATGGPVASLEGVQRATANPRHVVRHDPRYDLDPTLRALVVEQERALIAVRQSRARALWAHNARRMRADTFWHALMERDAELAAVRKRLREMGEENRRLGIARSEAERRAERLEEVLTRLLLSYEGFVRGVGRYEPGWLELPAVAMARAALGRPAGGEGERA